MDRLFQWKVLLLSQLKENLEYLSRKSHFHNPEAQLPFVYKNERMIRILGKIDKRISRSTHQNPALFQKMKDLLEECFILHTDFEIRWNEWRTSYHIELNEMEVRRQLRASLRRKPI